MKKKEEDSLKDLFKGEKIPEYNAQEAFENFERKFPLNDTYNEVSYKPIKKNRFKWLYWVPAVATAIVVIPISCIITNAVITSGHNQDNYLAYNYVKANYDKVLSIDNYYLTSNNLKQKVHTFYCEDNNGDLYFTTYANTNFILKITLNEDSFSFSNTNLLFEKKLENLDEFTYYIDFEGTKLEYSFNPKQYYDYFR